MEPLTAHRFPELEERLPDTVPGDPPNAPTPLATISSSVAELVSGIQCPTCVDPLTPALTRMNHDPAVAEMAIACAPPPTPAGATPDPRPCAPTFPRVTLAVRVPRGDAQRLLAAYAASVQDVRECGRWERETEQRGDREIVRLIAPSGCGGDGESLYASADTLFIVPTLGDRSITDALLDAIE